MFRFILLCVGLWCTMPAVAQGEYTKQMAAKMLAEITTAGEKVIVDREIMVRNEYTDFTFTANASAAGYHVTLVFPYSPGYTKFEGYATYGDEAKRVSFKYSPGDPMKKGSQIGYLYLKLTSKPGYVAHLRFKDVGNLIGATTYCRLMVVGYQ